jgi:GT2 family glycosyltransferase
MPSPPVSIIIPNWNGATLLERYLPAVLAELHAYNPQSECIIVDDGSTDNSIDVLQERFSELAVISRKRNSGFSTAVNDGVRAARYEHILTLNNDVEVRPGFLEELVRVFCETPDAFAVSSLQKQDCGKGDPALDGFNTLEWKHGHLETVNVTKKFLAGAKTRLAYCTAGCSLFSRTKLLDIGGFCELFDPFYYEDAEIGIQAAKRGWALAFAPKSVVYHRHGQTSRTKLWSLRFLPVRNYFFLHWLTLDDAGMWSAHILHIAWRCVVWTIQGRVRYLVGFLLALTKLHRVLTNRGQRARDWRENLRQILRTA